MDHCRWLRDSAACRYRDFQKKNYINTNGQLTPICIPVRNDSSWQFFIPGQMHDAQVVGWPWWFILMGALGLVDKRLGEWFGCPLLSEITTNHVHWEQLFVCCSVIMPFCIWIFKKIVFKGVFCFVVPCCSGSTPWQRKRKTMGSAMKMWILETTCQSLEPSLEKERKKSTSKYFSVFFLYLLGGFFPVVQRGTDCRGHRWFALSTGSEEWRVGRQVWLWALQAAEGTHWIHVEHAACKWSFECFHGFRENWSIAMLLQNEVLDEETKKLTAVVDYFFVDQLDDRFKVPADGWSIDWLFMIWLRQWGFCWLIDWLISNAWWFVSRFRCLTSRISSWKPSPVMMWRWRRIYSESTAKFSRTSRPYGRKIWIWSVFVFFQGKTESELKTLPCSLAWIISVVCGKNSSNYPFGTWRSWIRWRRSWCRWCGEIASGANTPTHWRTCRSIRTADWSRITAQSIEPSPRSIWLISGLLFVFGLSVIWISSNIFSISIPFQQIIISHFRCIDRLIDWLFDWLHG